MTLPDQVRVELARLLAELNPMFAAEVPARVTRADMVLALDRPARTPGFAALGLAASVLTIGAWLVSNWSLLPAASQDVSPRLVAADVSTDPVRMTQVQSADDVVHLWAQSGAGNARVIRGQMWWSPSTGAALWARVEPLSGADALGYQGWLVSDRGTHYLGPIATDPAGTISVSFDPPPIANGRPVRLIVTLQPAARVDHPADRVVLEARF